MQNKQIRLATRPNGLPQPSDWQMTTEEIGPLSIGAVLVKTQYISLDPAMRGWMNAAKSYIRPVEIGEVMRAGTAGIVVDSQNEKFKVGEFVTGSFGVQEYYVSPAGDANDSASFDFCNLTNQRPNGSRPTRYNDDIAFFGRTHIQ